MLKLKDWTFVTLRNVVFLNSCILFKFDFLAEPRELNPMCLDRLEKQIKNLVILFKSNF